MLRGRREDLPGRVELAMALDDSAHREAALLRKTTVISRSAIRSRHEHIPLCLIRLIVVRMLPTTSSQSVLQMVSESRPPAKALGTQQVLACSGGRGWQRHSNNFDFLVQSSAQGRQHMVGNAADGSGS